MFDWTLTDKCAVGEGRNISSSILFSRGMGPKEMSRRKTQFYFCPHNNLFS